MWRKRETLAANDKQKDAVTMSQRHSFKASIQ